MSALTVRDFILPAASPRVNPPTYCTTWDYCTGCGLWDQIVWGKCGSCWRAEDPVIVRRTWPQQLQRDWRLKGQPRLDAWWAERVEEMADPTRWTQAIALIGIGGLIGGSLRWIR